MSRTSRSSESHARSRFFAVIALGVVALLTPTSSRADGRLWIGGLCVDTNGGHVFLAACVAGKHSQMWRWEDPEKREYNTFLGYTIPDGNTAARLVNFKYGKCLDAWGGKLNSGDPVGLYPCVNKANQMWDESSGLFEVGYWGKTVIKCLAVPNANFKVNQRLIIWDCADKKRSAADLRRRSQTFWAQNLGSFSPLYYSPDLIRGATFCLETDGNQIYVAKCSLPTKMEQWWTPRAATYVPPLTAKWVNIISADGRFAQKCMEVPDGRYVDGAELRLGHCVGDSAKQTFYFKGLYQVPPLGIIDVGRDGLCLAVDRGWVDGAKVVLRTCNENDVNQKFDNRLKRTEVSGG